MDLTEDAFRALARSSPWRWSTLHFTRRNAWGSVEAWVRRPGELVVRLEDGTEHRESGAPYARPTRTVFRPDGLVAARPDRWEVECDDPMWENYTWVAMLDPVELSHHVALEDLREGERAGRRTWSARMRPVAGYDPRCGCCPLLWSEISDRDEYANDDTVWSPAPDVVYPASYEVAVDVVTGVVVHVAPVGGTRSDLGLDVTIHEVDADLAHVFPAG